ncbi:hypothetical protein F5J12DRAFT_786867 [Pisolithus orientalis]|uniref:uncharacterized protein n=1 Tax=Pisolithus orientalis TaxID=936130 RepID=UPI002225A7CA|nr:uncharacterized protein F5J12DRAFT_786867 [Pisolithus orientalis]KAI5988474.1 hypothetical protein F5J12DRAFT_786867 [Pisolithus orientalis]
MASSDNSAYTICITHVKSKNSGEASQLLIIPIKCTTFVLSSHGNYEEEEIAFQMGCIKHQGSKKGKKESEQALLTPPCKLLVQAPLALTKNPTRKVKKTWPRKLPTHDSPDNPSLSSTKVLHKKGPSEWDCLDDEACEPVLLERLTITYVFVSPDAVVALRLPIDHPDYEPLESLPVNPFNTTQILDSNQTQERPCAKLMKSTSSELELTKSVSANQKGDDPIRQAHGLHCND